MLSVVRSDGRTAVLSRSGQPDRTLPLPRRERGDLLAEELRRLDADQVYAEALAAAFSLTELNDRPQHRRHVWRDIAEAPSERIGEFLPGVSDVRATGGHTDPSTVEVTAREMLAADRADQAKAAAAVGDTTAAP